MFNQMYQSPLQTCVFDILTMDIDAIIRQAFIYCVL